MSALPLFDMHLSRYCKVYPSPTSPSKLILFSTKNAAIAELPASLLRKIRKGSPIPENDENLLRRMGLLVKDPKRERQRMIRYIGDLNRVSSFLSIKVVMGLDCNLACKYCFEGNRKGKFYMTDETAEEVVGFVRKCINGASFPVVGNLSESEERCQTSRHDKNSRVLNRSVTSAIDEIYLTFYGGEPLLSKKLITTIAKKVKSLARRHGKKFSFSLQTNGTLLTKKTVGELRPLGLVEAFVTVDGTEDIHDCQRPYKSGKGSFGRIIRNIQDVCGLIDVRLSGNFTKKNFGRFTGLLDFLLMNNLGPDRLHSVQFFPVVSERKDVLADFNDGCVSINEPWLVKAGLYLREEIVKRGYRMVPVTPVVCMMEHQNNFLVNYDGTIYKCPGLIGRKEFVAGNVQLGIGDYGTSHDLDNWKNEKCLDCCYLPLCFGGCRYMKYVRDGNMVGVDCKKPYFDATLEALVSQDIRYGLVKQ